MARETSPRQVRSGVGHLQVRRIADHAELAASARDWNLLAERHPDALPFNTYAWVSAFFEHRLRPGESWVCLQAWREGALLGVLPITLRPARRAGIAGTVASTPFDAHTQFSHFLVEPRVEAEVVRVLTAAALGLARDLFLVEFQGLRAESALPAAPTASSTRWSSLTTSAGTGAFLPLEGDFESFRAALSRKFRSNLNRATHKLARHAGAGFTRTRAADAAQADLDGFLEAEAAGWKGAAGTAIRCDPGLVDFYTTLTRRLAAAGWLEWQSLQVEGRTIASVLAAVIGCRVFLVKIGVDEALPELSPGVLLIEHVIKRAFEDGIREVDFLTDPAWVQPWRPEHRANRYVTVYPGSVRSSLLAYVPHRLARFAKELPWVRPVGRAMRGAVRRLAGRGSAGG